VCLKSWAQVLKVWVRVENNVSWKYILIINHYCIFVLLMLKQCENDNVVKASLRVNLLWQSWQFLNWTEKIQTIWYKIWKEQNNFFHDSWSNIFSILPMLAMKLKEAAHILKVDMKLLLNTTQGIDLTIFIEIWL